jgi:DNA replication protein DnaC
MGKYIHIRLCDDCEAVQAILDIRTARIEKAAKFQRMLKREIPELFLDAHLKRISSTALELIKSREPGQGIYLWGKVGRGKTYIAAAMMRYFILNGRRAKRARFRDIAHEIQKTYDGTGSTELVLEKYVNADLLSIEDVGTGKSVASEFDIEMLLKLIDKRMEAKKTTIITSNKNMEGMADTFDTRIFSRLNTFLIIEMTGQDRRKGNT